MKDAIKRSAHQVIPQDPGRVQVFGLTTKDQQRVRRAFLNLDICRFTITGYIEQIAWGDCAGKALTIRVSGEPITMVVQK